MLLSLPPELLISVFRFLPLPDISSCIQTSRALKSFVDQHESAVYRQAAAHPSFRLIPHDQLLFSELIPLGLLSKRYIGDASDWKSLCGCLLIARCCACLSCWGKVVELARCILVGLARALLASRTITMRTPITQMSIVSRSTRGVVSLSQLMGNALQNPKAE